MSKKIKYAKKYGAICILDALGTKGIWREKNPETVIQNWEDFINSVDTNLHSDSGQMDLSLHAFSDTLIVTCSGDLPIEKLLYELSYRVTSLLGVGLLFGIFLRGCVSIGNFYQSEKMILGPAIDEAAQSYEIANWIGVHLTSSAFSVVDRFRSKSDVSSGPKSDILLSSLFKLYSVPTKNNGSLNTYALTLYVAKDLFNRPEFSKMFQISSEIRTLRDFLHHHLEYSNDVEGLDKWKNTLDFVKSFSL